MSPVSITRAAVRIVVDYTIGNSHTSLVDFDGIEASEIALDGGGSTPMSDQGVVNARRRCRPEIQTAPVPGRRPVADQVLGGHKRPACPETAVQQGCEYHLLSKRTFSNELGSDLGLDTGTVQLGDYAGVDPQSGVGALLQYRGIGVQGIWDR